MHHAHRWTAVERLQQCLAAIGRLDPQLNAMITVDEAGALRAAAAADQARAAGQSLGPLHGTVIAVKDNIDTSALRTTYGSRFFIDHVPAEDAEVVRRLRRAGAVIVGKTSLHEFAFGTRTVNVITGQCRNPWDLDRIPGGSSGGSAVAVASAMADVALGTDTGASIRLPAALTGTTGLRPTVGAVSNRGCFPLSPTHDVIGPIARSATDAARLFCSIAGFDSGDPFSRAHGWGDIQARLDDGITGLRVGRPTQHYFEHASGQVADAVDRAIECLARLGARIVDIDIAGASDMPQWFSVMLLADARNLHAVRLRRNRQYWEPQTLARLQAGARYRATDYAQAMRMRERWHLTLARVFDDVDLLAFPTCPSVAPLIDEPRSLLEASRALSLNAACGSFGGLPGLSLPCGFSSEGLPIGIEFSGPPWSEALLLRAGVAYQSVTDWHRRAPSLVEPPMTRAQL